MRIHRFAPRAACALPLLASLVLAAATGCVAPPVPVTGVPEINETWYTAHTLKGSRSGNYEILFRSNFTDHPVVAPPGKKVEIQMYSSARIDLTVDERPCRMHWKDFPFPTDPRGVVEFLNKHFVKDPSATGLDRVADVAKTNSINLGTAAINMTKDEVVLALGFPSHVGPSKIPAAPLSRERIYEFNEWYYRAAEFAWIPWWQVCHFSTDGTLLSVQR